MCLFSFLLWALTDIQVPTAQETSGCIVVLGIVPLLTGATLDAAADSSASEKTP